jgi:hypothetical protein
LKLLQENTEKPLEDIGIDRNFLNKTLIAQELKARFKFKNLKTSAQQRK